MDDIDFEELEDELAKIDPEELRNLLQLLSENVPAVQKIIQNVLDEPISEETQKRFEPIAPPRRRNRRQELLRRFDLFPPYSEILNLYGGRAGVVCDYRLCMAVTEAIKMSPPELRERFYKEYLATKLRQRNEMGWKEIHDEMIGGPFCEKQRELSKILICRKCTDCGLTGLCVLCFKNNVYHYLAEDNWKVYGEKFLEWW